MVVSRNTKTINLEHGLGRVQVILSPEFDTVDSWIRKSDCHCCDKQIYRFANSNYDLYRIAGEFTSHKYDSIFQFTIVQEAHGDCISQSDPIKKILQSMTESIQAENITNTILKSEIFKINGREFAIIEQMNRRDSVHIYNLTEMTFLRDNIP